MFKPTAAKTVASYLAAVPAERRKAMLALHDLIRKAAPNLKPHFAYNMLGYGSFPYRNYKGEAITWPIVALANQKNYISVYVCAVDKGRYVAEAHKKELGKVSVGKSCIRFRKLEDVDLPALRKVIRIAAKKPGLVDAGRRR
jgi:uncharacterized protein YdhG (YjbR/CyaY superfamily)